MRSLNLHQITSIDLVKYHNPRKSFNLGGHLGFPHAADQSCARRERKDLQEQIPKFSKT